MSHRPNGPTARPWQLMAFLAPAVIVYGLFSALPLADNVADGACTRRRTVRRCSSSGWPTSHHPRRPEWSAAFWETR